METPDFSHADFAAAIGADNLKLARDLVAQFPPDTGGERQKLNAYRAIFDCAIYAGEISAALEVAPFCGHKISEKDILDCQKMAIQNGKLTEVLVCKKRLGKDFTWEEIAALKVAMDSKGLPMPYAFNIMGLLYSKNPLTRELLRIITTNIPLWKLSEDEQLLIQIMEIVT